MNWNRMLYNLVRFQIILFLDDKNMLIFYMIDLFCNRYKSDDAFHVRFNCITGNKRREKLNNCKQNTRAHDDSLPGTLIHNDQ